MDSQPTFSLRFLNRKGDEIPAPLEWGEGFVEVVLPQGVNWHHVHLTVHAMRQPPTIQFVDGKERARCIWPPSGVGRHQIVVHHEEDHPISFAIRPRKISEEAFGQLIEDLTTRLTGGVALSLQRAGAFAGLRLLPREECTLAQEQLRLRRAVYGTPERRGLAQVLDQLAVDHHKTLTVVDEWKPAEKVRRIRPQRLGAALQKPRNISADNSLIKAPERKVIHSADVYENRVLRVFRDQVARRLGLLIAASKDLSLDKSLSQSLDISEAFDRARRRAKFLDGVCLPALQPDKVTMVLLKQPVYRAALEGYLEFQRSIAVTLDDPGLEAPLENLPHLYQLWGTLQVMQVILDMAHEAGWGLKSQNLMHRHTQGAYVKILTNGIPALVFRNEFQKTTLNVIPERTYSSKAHGLGSVSHSQRPDIAVEFHPDGQQPEVFLFDPKYKLKGEATADDATSTAALKSDIDKMHTYRDAICWNGANRVVRHAAILHPGQTRDYGPHVSALRSDPACPEALVAGVRSILAERLARS